MQMMMAFYLYGLSLAVCITMGVQAWRGSHPILSLRNLFLVGFVIFQTLSAALSLTYNRFGKVMVFDPGRAGFIFAAMCTVFLLVFLFVYDRGWLVRQVARKTATNIAPPSTATLIFLAILLTLLGGIFRLQLPLGLLAKIGGIVGPGFSSAACVLAGWVLVRHFRNPVFLLTCGLVIAANAGIVAIGAFGRRGLVGVFAAVLWGMYHRSWRPLGFGAQVRRLGLAAIGPIILVAAFTSVRSSSDMRRSLTEHLLALRDARIGTGIEQLSTGQGTGGYALWLIENFPSGQWESRPFLTIWLTFLNNVPREWWVSKPVVLSVQFPEMARLWGTDWSVLTITVGIIGTAVTEGGWYAVVVYAIFLALMLRFFDEAIRIRPQDPFVVAAFGVGLGQILGLARGETCAFANIYLIEALACCVFFLAFNKLFRTGSPSAELYLQHQPPLHQP